MTTPTKAQLRAQLQTLRSTGFADKLQQQGNTHALPVAYIYAIASRETNCRNILGDFVNGEAHGVGIMQIDIQHPIARQARDSGSWQTNPDALIEFGAQMLRTNIDRAAQALPTSTAQDHLKVAASGYNHGITGAIADARAGDSDTHTTGHDYGRDVMARMAIFEQLIANGTN